MPEVSSSEIEKYKQKIIEWIQSNIMILETVDETIYVCNFGENKFTDRDEVIRFAHTEVTKEDP